MSFNASLLVMMGIFWIVYLILRFSFFKPMLDLLEKRSETIDGARSIYDKALADADERLEAERVRLSEARSTAMASREQERRAAQERRLEQLSRVKAQVHDTLTNAADELDARVREERDSLEVRARELADVIAQRLLGRPA